MENIIRSKLNKIEGSEVVKIVFACESGSRAWGFPSSDSDYDVRFLYIHHTDWYLSIDEKRDVIECPLQKEERADVGDKLDGLFRESLVEVW